MVALAEGFTQAAKILLILTLTTPIKHILNAMSIALYRLEGYSPVMTQSDLDGICSLVLFKGTDARGQMNGLAGQVHDQGHMDHYKVQKRLILEESETV